MSGGGTAGYYLKFLPYQVEYLNIFLDFIFVFYELSFMSFAFFIIGMLDLLILKSSLYIKNIKSSHKTTCGAVFQGPEQIVYFSLCHS